MSTALSRPYSPDPTQRTLTVDGRLPLRLQQPIGGGKVLAAKEAAVRRQARRVRRRQHVVPVAFGNHLALLLDAFKAAAATCRMRRADAALAMHSPGAPPGALGTAQHPAQPPHLRVAAPQQEHHALPLLRQLRDGSIRELLPMDKGGAVQHSIGSGAASMATHESGRAPDLPSPSRSPALLGV